MKKILILLIIFASFSIVNAEKRGIEKVQIKLTLKNGTSYTAYLKKDNSFTIKGIDDDCDGATLEIVSSNTEAQARAGKAKYKNIVLKRGQISDKTSNPLYEDKGQNAENPIHQSSRKSASVIYDYQNIELIGDIDGDGKEDNVCFDLKKKDKELSGMLCGKTEHF